MTTRQATFDYEGHPSNASLDEITLFFGTPEEYVQFTSELFGDGVVRVDDTVNAKGHPIKHVTYLSAGARGSEAVIGQIMQDTVFERLFWESSHRGGVFIFEIQVHLWQNEMPLGSLKLIAEAKAADEARAADPR